MTLLYQPKFHLDTMELIGVETSLHWNHPRLGLLAAAEFMHVVEESGFTIPIGEWVLDTACGDAARWYREGQRAVVVSVNLPAWQFQHDRLIEGVRRALARSRLTPSSLELCIGENIAMQDVERTVRILRQLTGFGVRVAISEFGVRFHSSIDDVKRMPVSAIKIDHRFIRDLHSNPGKSSIIESMIRLSRRPQLHVVATGVESQAQADQLRALHCDHVQGDCSRRRRLHTKSNA